MSYYVLPFLVPMWITGIVWSL